MTQIRTLPPEVTAKIAAGEVIERPSYAIKELIENALDAQATHIHIDVIRAGLTKITITDDGIGMSKGNVLLSYLPHTTSKISTEEDLYSVKSFGFRGEALASIASISTLTIQSRRKTDSAGYQVVVKHGKLIKQTIVGMPVGTKITIEDLFGNVPVRKKFLKSERTEARHILDIVQTFALSYPTVGFEYIHNDKNILFLAEHETLEERITSLFGNTAHINSIPIQSEDLFLKTSGFLGKPQISYTNTSKVFIFVNRRNVFDPLITTTIKEAYGNLLEKNTFPFVILFLDLPYEHVDVNVHPRKEQIKFVDPLQVSTLLHRAITEQLINNNLTFHNISWKKGLTKTNFAKELRSQLLTEDVAQISSINKTSEIVQLHNLYLIIETKRGLMIIDQHAAHEAILFETLKEKYFDTKSKQKSVLLSPSIVIDLSKSELQTLQEFEDYFINLGFEIEEFGDTSIKISQAPEFFTDFDLRALFAEILADFVNNSFPKDIDDRSYKMLAYLACRNAIKSGEFLDRDQRQKLIETLSEHHYSYTCPHGRPVKIEFSLNELDRIFKRSG